MTTPPKYLLIASAGRSDIKFLATKNNAYKLAEIFSGRKDLCYLSLREIHEQMLSGGIPVTFAEISPKEIKGKDKDKDKDKKNCRIRFCQKQNRIEADMDKGFKPQKDKQGNYRIYAAKLQGLIQTLKKKAATNELQIAGALFIGTERPDDDPDADREPVASHRLLAKYFARQLSLNYAGELPDDDTQQASPCPVYWLNQLKDLPDKQGYKYEGTGLDYPVKRIIAKRIDDSIRRFMDYFDPDTGVILSHTGGMADLKDLLSASVRFRAPADVLDSPQTEKSENFDSTMLDQLIKEKNQISRRESLQVKALVQNRIREGDIAGAWAACAHIHHDNNTNHDIWTYAIEAAKNYYAGDNTFDLEDIINRAPDNIRNTFQQLHQALQALTTTAEDDFKKQSKSALTRTLFHIESALQASNKNEMNIIQATIHSSSLNDQLLRTCIYHYLDKYRADFPHLKETLHFDNDEVLTKAWCDAQDRRFKTTRKPTRTTKKIDAFGGRDNWRDKLEQDANLIIAKTFSTRMYINNETPKSLSTWRNTIAHGLGMQATDQQHILTIATKEFVTKKNKNHYYPIWNPKLLNTQAENHLPLATGTCILNQHYTHLIEEKLGYPIGSTQQKYTELQQLLLEIIRSPIYINPEQ